VQADVQVDYKQKTVTYSSVESYLRLETTILDSPVVADHLTAALFSDWLRRELFAAFWLDASIVSSELCGYVITSDNKVGKVYVIVTFSPLPVYLKVIDWFGETHVEK